MARATSMTLVLAVGGALGVAAECQAKASADWAVVESIRAGQRVRVRVRDDDRPKRGRLLRGGVFMSATADHCTVVTKDGGTVSLSRADVLTVATRRRLSKRPRPLIHAAIVVGGWALFMERVGEPNASAMIPAIPFGIGGYAFSALAPGYGLVYVSSAAARK